MAVHKATISIVADTDKDETDVTITMDPPVSNTQENYAANTALVMLRAYQEDRS